MALKGSIDPNWPVLWRASCTLILFSLYTSSFRIVYIISEIKTTWKQGRTAAGKRSTVFKVNKSFSKNKFVSLLNLCFDFKMFFLWNLAHNFGRKNLSFGHDQLQVFTLIWYLWIRILIQEGQWIRTQPDPDPLPFTCHLNKDQIIMTIFHIIVSSIFKCLVYKRSPPYSPCPNTLPSLSFIPPVYMVTCY